MITDRQIGKQIVNILPANKTGRDFQFPVILYRHGNQVFLRFLLLRERKIITIHLIT